VKGSVFIFANDLKRRDYDNQDDALERRQFIAACQRDWEAGNNYQMMTIIINIDLAYKGDNL